jgi:hypothetical protein
MRKLFLLSALSVSLLIAPAVANASPTGHQLAAARDALHAARSSALAGNASSTASYAHAALRHSNRAERAAKDLTNRSKRAEALTKVAAFDDQSFGTFIALLDQVPASVQDEVAQALAQSGVSEGQVIDLLTQLANNLPEPARTDVLEAITKFESDGDVQALIDVLTSGDVVSSVQSYLQEQLGSILDQVNGILAHLDAMADQLPPDAAAQVHQAIAMIESQLGSLQSLFNSLPGLGSLCDLIPLPICP